MPDAHHLVSVITMFLSNS